MVLFCEKDFDYWKLREFFIFIPNLPLKLYFLSFRNKCTTYLIKKERYKRIYCNEINDTFKGKCKCRFFFLRLILNCKRLYVIFIICSSFIINIGDVICLYSCQCSRIMKKRRRRIRILRTNKIKYNFDIPKFNFEEFDDLNAYNTGFMNFQFLQRIYIFDIIIVLT